MNISIFLAQLMGLVFVIVGLATFIKRDFIREAIRDFIDHAGLLFISATFNLTLGLLIILSHNIWELSWRGLITLLGYLILLRGLLHLFAPSWVRKIAKNFIRWEAFVYSGVISLALGIYLLYHGFSAFFQKAMSLM
jgi:uncharacterized protein YjeT (DUF2065 family)